MEQVLADQLAAQHGVVSREWLRNHGFSAARMRTMLEHGGVSDDDIDLRLRPTVAELARIYRSLPLAT